MKTLFSRTRAVTLGLAALACAIGLLAFEPRPAHADVPTSSYSLTRAVYGTPVLLGTIAYGAAAKNNHDTSVPFNNTGNGLAGKLILVTCTTDCLFAVGTTNAVAASAANGVPLVAGEKQPFVMTTYGNTYGWISAIRSSADGSMKVWELLP